MSVQVSLPDESTATIQIDRGERSARVTINGRTIHVRIGGDDPRWLILEGIRAEYRVAVIRDVVHLHYRGESWRLGVRDLDFAKDSDEAAEDVVLAPMPGVVVAIRAREGDIVAAGDVVLAIESMKMQSDLTVPRAGRVARLNVGVGDTFSAEDTLLILDPRSEDASNTEPD